MSPAGVNPGNDFTNRVMSGVKARPRKIGLWNLVYIVPLVLAIALLVTPSTRNFMLDSADSKRSTVNAVQTDVDNMSTLVNDLDDFDDNSLNSVEFVISDDQQ